MEIFESISKAFLSGGIWMWAILGMQIFAIAIILERTFALFIKRKPNQTKTAIDFETDIRRGDIESVQSRAKTLPVGNPIARVIEVGAQAALNLGGKDEIQGKMDEVLMEENALTERRIGFLAMIANVATLAGLLGTITGMIQSFSAVTSANPAEKATMLSEGISVAMNTTAYGLIVAIPALLFYSILLNRSNFLIEDLNKGSLKVFNWLSFAYEPQGLRVRPVRRAVREPEANA